MSAGALQIDDQLARDGGGGLMPMVVGDECEREIDSGGDASGGPDVAVVDVDGIEIDRDTCVRVVEEGTLRPMRGRGSSLQQSCDGEKERAGADRRYPARISGEPVDLGKQLAVGDCRSCCTIRGPPNPREACP